MTFTASILRDNQNNGLSVYAVVPVSRTFNFNLEDKIEITWVLPGSLRLPETHLRGPAGNPAVPIEKLLPDWDLFIRGLTGNPAMPLDELLKQKKMPSGAMNFEKSVAGQSFFCMATGIAWHCGGGDRCRYR